MRRTLGRKALPSGRTVDAVGRDDEIGADATVLEDRDGPAVRVVVDAHEPSSELDGVAPEAVDDRGVEDFLEATAMDGQLGPGVPRGETPRLAPDLLAASCGVEQQRRRDRAGLELAEQSELVELTDRVRQQVDPHAERAQLARRVEDRGADPDLLQAQRGGEAADSRTHDDAADVGKDHAQSTSWTWMRTTERFRSPMETARRSLSHARRWADVESRMCVRK